jgi:hypothetical protein
MRSSSASEFKDVLPKIHFKRAEDKEEIFYFDFSICFNKARLGLQACYEKEFRNHPKFIKLVGELYKKEIEYNFLEEAEVIKKTIIAMD